MFVLPLVAFVGGITLMGRRAPQTAVRKLICLGPRSGMVYPVEDFPEIGVVVVRAPNKAAVAQFLRAAVREPGKPGLVYQQGQGDAQLLELIRQDFAVPQAKLAAVGEAGSGKVPGPSPEGASEPKPLTPKPKAASAAPSSKASTPSGI